MSDGVLDQPPTVSVLIPVYDAGEHIRACLDSVMGQTIGLGRLEVIAVDDGSTDGSGAILDDYATRYPQVRVFHEPNSGGPGRPRNIGIAHATGTFIFFIDADDYLGPEALERMVAMASRNGTDIVLGRMVGFDGRHVPTRAFRRTLDRARVEDVYSTLSILKLFRRSLIERVGLRFEEGLAGHEDGVFMALAYLEADGISVVADYDCYFYRRGNLRGTAVDRLVYLADIERRMDVVAAHRPPGPGRDRLMDRHVVDVLRVFGAPWLALDAERRERVFDVAAGLIARCLPDGRRIELPQPRAIRLYCLQHGLRSELEDIVACPPAVANADPIVEGGRAYARYPHFRDAAGIPDAYFEIGNRASWRKRLIRQLGKLEAAFDRRRRRLRERLRRP